jgi:hypothetical protein
MNDERQAFESWGAENIGQFSRAGHYATGGRWVYAHNIQELASQAFSAGAAWADAQKAPQPRTAEPAGCGYPYCGGNAPECKTCGNKRAAPAPADEPPPLDIIAQAKRILVLVDRCIENHTAGNRSDLRAALLEELGAAKLQAERSKP